MIYLSLTHLIDKIVCPTGGRKKFREFLRSEYSEENLMFWLACEDLRKESNSASVEEKARLIYEDFISILSPKEVRKIFFPSALLFYRLKLYNLSYLITIFPNWTQYQM